jgi:hypothetical protein
MPPGNKVKHFGRILSAKPLTSSFVAPKAFSGIFIKPSVRPAMETARDLQIKPKSFILTNKQRDLLKNIN